MFLKKKKTSYKVFLLKLMNERANLSCFFVTNSLVNSRLLRADALVLIILLGERSKAPILASCWNYKEWLLNKELSPIKNNDRDLDPTTVVWCIKMATWFVDITWPIVESKIWLMNTEIFWSKLLIVSLHWVQKFPK